MRCHYCERDAAVSAETDGVRVGLCEEHFHERMEELAESEEIRELEEKIDVDSIE